MGSSFVKVIYRELSFLGFPGYRVGMDGSVWTCKIRVGRKYLLTNKWKPLKLTVRKSGYLFVTLWHNGKSGVFPVHKLVLLSFVGYRPEGMQCRHLDGNPRNNQVDNLKWGTPKEDAADKRRHGTQLYGVDVPTSKIKQYDADDIRMLYSTGNFDQFELGKMFGVHGSTVGEIVRNEIWVTEDSKPIVRSNRGKRSTHPVKIVNCGRCSNEFMGRMKGSFCNECQVISRREAIKKWEAKQYK